MSDLKWLCNVVCATEGSDPSCGSRGGRCACASETMAKHATERPKVPAKSNKPGTASSDDEMHCCALCDDNSYTNLMCAAQKKDCRGIKRIFNELQLSHKKDKLQLHNKVFAQRACGRTALFDAVECGSADCVEALLVFEPEKQVAWRLPDGMMPLMVAAKLGHLACAKVLLKHCPSVQLLARTPEGHTALTSAMLSAFESGNTDCVEALLLFEPREQ
eukprot:244527-Chlamydomonas_euryale.AAC.1